jgi:anti-anti-sigma factor
MDGSPFPEYFDVSIEQGEGFQCARLNGELDLASGPQLEELLMGLVGPSVVVDLSGLRFIDSSGFGALLRAQRLVERAGRGLVFRGPLSPEVARTFEMLGMAEITDGDEDLEAPPEGG